MLAPIIGALPLAVASSQTGVGVLMVDGASSKDMHSCQGHELLLLA
jgi:hypothetical protein